VTRELVLRAGRDAWYRPTTWWYWLNPRRRRTARQRWLADVVETYPADPARVGFHHTVLSAGGRALVEADQRLVYDTRL
jgi:hypothetical protein